MRSLLSVALLAGSAIANPLMARGDDCLAAVTGSWALGDASLRSSHCSSFIKTIVTPAATTVTVTITGTPTPSATVWKRDVTVCPNEVPNYASACNTAAYKSACSVFGIWGDSTLTIPATTTTKTVYWGNGAPNGICTSTDYFTTTVSACSGGTTTSTVTVGPPASITVTTTMTTSVGTVTTTSTSVSTLLVGPGQKSTVTSTSTTTATLVTTATTTSTTVSVSTVTVTDPGSAPAAATCLASLAQAQVFVDAFNDLLEYTSYNGTSAPPGRGYHYNVSATYLAVDFQDYSDSINWMAGFPLHGVTFNSRAAFDYGQGLLQPELTMTQLNVDFGCKTIHYRWSALTSSGANVQGINYFTLTDDLTQIQTNYAEFNNADWIQSFARFAAPGTINCVVPGSNSTVAKRSFNSY